MQVKATSMGYYGAIRRKPGAVFEIEDSHFSKKWMKKLAESKPSKKEEKKEGKKEEKPSSETEVI